VAKLQAEGRTACFVGDGINDSIALKKADVSISLRGASSLATDTAQVVFLTSRDWTSRTAQPSVAMGRSTPSQTLCYIFVVNGKSYRFRQSMKQNKDWKIGPGVKLPLLLRIAVFTNGVGFHFLEQQPQSLQDDQFQTRSDW